MKKSLLVLFITCIGSHIFGQSSENQKLIELSKTYKNFMFINETPKNVLLEMNKDVPENLKASSEFIAQTISSNNNLLTPTYLFRPNDATLKQIFIIDAIFQNLRAENQVDNNVLIDSLKNANTSVYVLLDNYYGMLFTAVGNKNKPFNFSKVDYTINDYGLKDDTEKGIFVLRSMAGCHSAIWGYMNIVKPANTKEAYKYIKKYPKINGQVYYQFTDFYFKDFEMIIVEDKGMQSYKSFYLDKFYEILIFHLICLNSEGGSQKEKNELLLGSILKESNLYKYTKYKNTLETIFKEQK